MEQKQSGRRSDRGEGGSITVRPMELEDLAAVFALGEALFTADQWPNLYRTWDEYEPVDLFSSDREFCLVAERDDRVIGFALGNLIAKRRSAWRYGYLQWLGVDSACKRRGVARRLVERLTEQFIEAGARIMIIDTEAENEAAVRFFERQGFGQQVEHVYMSKNLTNHPEYQRLRPKSSSDRSGGS